VSQLVLVVNPGSSSRKYALFSGNSLLASINFEQIAGKVTGSIDIDGTKHVIETSNHNLKSVICLVEPTLKKHDVLKDDIFAIGVRLVAPSKAFTSDQMINDEVIQSLERISHKAPLHITTVLEEIHQIKKTFLKTPLVAISDTAFHTTIPEWASRYGISTDIADKHEILRYGYHGISVQSVVDIMQENKILMPKVIVCHLGSGCSVTAVKKGQSVETSMGYSPLEGLMMATRSGSIDVSAALAVKHELQFSDDHLEEYLNKKSGLLGVSGKSNDIRELLKLEKSGDKNAQLALKMFVYRIQQTIGQMVASLDGVQCLVFTATIGERSSPIRARVIDGLKYLDFAYDKSINEDTYEPTGVVDISSDDSKPVLVIPTSESEQITKRVTDYLKAVKA